MRSSENGKFFNEGFGWVCRNCDESSEDSSPKKSRLMSEGEAETKNPMMSASGLAKWIDGSRSELECPACGLRDSVSGG